MTSREFARYNGTPKNDIPENDIPENDIPENDVPIMPMKKKPPMEKSNGWRKTALRKTGRKDEWLTLEGDFGQAQMKWTAVKEGSDTYRNLCDIVKGADRKWRIRWFKDQNGVTRILEILTDEQYEKYRTSLWHNR